jgi:hypothetical protein
MKNKTGSKRIDLTDFIQAAEDPNNTFVEMAIVKANNGPGSHFEIYDDNGLKDIYMEVELIPTGEQMTVRLGLGNQAVWRIPEPDTEVVILFPGGSFTGYAYIAAITDKTVNGGIPSTLDADTYVINNPKKIILTSQNSDIIIEAPNGNIIIGSANSVQLNGNDQPIALKTSSVDGGSLVFSPGTGGAALAYVPSGDGYSGVIPPGGLTIPMTGGVITSGSSKVSAGE